MKRFLKIVALITFSPCFSALTPENEQLDILHTTTVTTRAPRPASTVAPVPSIAPAIQSVVQTAIQRLSTQPLTVSELTVTGATNLEGKVSVTNTLNLASGTINGDLNVTGHLCLGTQPTNNCDATTKQYVDDNNHSFSIKDPCKALSDSSVTLSGEKTIDGISVTEGQRVLLIAQTNSVQNGIWLVETGAWQRPSDFWPGDSAFLAYTFIQSGTHYANTGWVCNNSVGSATINHDALTFVQFSSPGVYTMTNVGTGTGQVYKELDGTEFRLRSIKAGTNIDVTNNTSDITLATTSNINVQGNLTVNTDKFIVDGTTGQTTLKGNFIIENSSGTPLFSISNTTGNLCSAGRIAASQSSCSVSDARIKTNINNLDQQKSLELINQLKPVSFYYTKKWQEAQHASEKTNFGLIAQDVQKIIPELVCQTEFPSGQQVYTVSYEQLIPFLINAVQQLSSEVVVLRKNLAFYQKS